MQKRGHLFLWKLNFTRFSFIEVRVNIALNTGDTWLVLVLHSITSSVVNRKKSYIGRYKGPCYFIFYVSQFNELLFPTIDFIVAFGSSVLSEFLHIFFRIFVFKVVKIISKSKSMSYASCHVWNGLTSIKYVLIWSVYAIMRMTY